MAVGEEKGSSFETSKEKLATLFQKLDINGDGRIDARDLSEGLSKLNIPHVPGGAQALIERADANQSNDLSITEFINYLQEQEKKLLLVFHALDVNKDGRVDEAELISSFKRLGIKITKDESQRLLHRMDKDGTLDISFDEWRDYLLFHPSTNLHDIILYWRHATNLDLGEDLSVPDDFSKEEWVSGEWWRHLVSGGFAGVGSRTATAPLDRLKIYLQVYGFKHNKNLLQCIKYMKKEGGIFSLWRGNGINVLKIAPESAIKFFAYEQSKKLIYNFHNRNGEEIELKTTDRLLAGSMAGVVSQSTIFPMEVLKIRLALRTTGQYKGIFDAVYKIYKNEGIKSFYRGYIPNLFGIIPYAGIDFAVYESLKNYYLKRHNDKDEPAWFVITACGALSSSCGQFAAYPFALVRTRLQAQVRSKEGKFDQPTTMLGLFKHIVKNEGLKGLYRGITPNFMKVAPSAAISYYIYEKCRQAFGVKMT